MRRRAFEQTLPDVRLAEEQLNVLFRPFAGGERLQEHHDLLKIHLDELVGPFHQEGSTNVEMKFREAIFFSLRGGKGRGLVSPSKCKSDV